MDTANEIYIFVSAILIAIMVAKRWSRWMANIYQRTKRSKNQMALIFNDLYEIFALEGA